MSGSSPEQIKAVTNSIVQLAYGNAVFGGMPISDAAIEAKSAFTANYEYLGAARIPTDKYDAVQGNAAHLLATLDDKAIALPAIIGKPNMPTAEEYIDTLKAAPTWITSPRGDALQLMDMGGRLVRDHRGHPITVPFNAPPSAPYVPPLPRPMR
jgi:hypothetical protein